MTAYRPLRLRRLAVLRVIAHPLAAARALALLAEEAYASELKVAVILKACAIAHVDRGPLR